jgi:hypothetical protein
VDSAGGAGSADGAGSAGIVKTGRTGDRGTSKDGMHGSVNVDRNKQW